jgi:hypothetical protein
VHQKARPIIAKVVTLNALYEGIAGGNVLADSALEIHALTHSTFIASGRVVWAEGERVFSKNSRLPSQLSYNIFTCFLIYRRLMLILISVSRS